MTCPTQDPSVGKILLGGTRQSGNNGKKLRGDSRAPCQEKLERNELCYVMEGLQKKSRTSVSVEMFADTIFKARLPLLISTILKRNVCPALSRSAQYVIHFISVLTVAPAGVLGENSIARPQRQPHIFGKVPKHSELPLGP